MSLHHGGKLLGLGACALSVQLALATTVTLKVTNGSATGVADTVIVFDPLDATPPPGHEDAVIDQVNKRFVPRITVVRTGTAVTFPNSDQIRHQVYSFSSIKPFNLKLYAGSPRTDVVFDKPGLVVLGCNIHDTMVAFVGVVDSPYFARTGPSGNADVTLPPGLYRLRVWHPGLTAAVPPRKVEVGNGPISIPVTVDIDPAGDAVAAWPE